MNTRESKLLQLQEKAKNFATQTTVHGFPRLVAPKLHPIERLLWLTVIVAATIGSIALASESVIRYYANPTVVSIQKDFRNWYNPFPSATACFDNKVDEEAMQEYIKNTWGVSETDGEKYEYYKSFITVMANASYYNLATLEEYQGDPTLSNIDFMDLVTKVHPPLTGTLVTFDALHKSEWQLVITELGVCFTVNSKIDKYFLIKTNKDDKPEGNVSDSDYVLHCHYLNGLCYARYDSDPTLPLTIHIHSYLDIAHATSEISLHVNENEELEINFLVEQISASPSLHSLTPAQRQCRFDNEPIGDEISVYSTSICYIACRYRFVMNICKCKPFFYHNFPGKECDLDGLLCVARIAHLLTKSPLDLGCYCAQPCDFVRYLALVPKISVWEYGYFDQRLTFRWGLLPPTTKYRRDIIFSFEDLIVSIGGTLALFLGVSFISAIEIIFFALEFMGTSFKSLRNGGFKGKPKKIDVYSVENRFF